MIWIIQSGLVVLDNNKTVFKAWQLQKVPVIWMNEMALENCKKVSKHSFIVPECPHNNTKSVSLLPLCTYQERGDCVAAEWHFPKQHSLSPWFVWIICCLHGAACSVLYVPALSVSSFSTVTFLVSSIHKKMPVWHEKWKKFQLHGCHCECMRAGSPVYNLVTQTDLVPSGKSPSH